MCDFKSPYNNMEEDSKKEILKKDFFNSTWSPDEDISKAIIKYNLLQETPSMRLLKDAKKALDKIRNYYTGVDLNERTERGAIVNKITDLSSSMSNIGRMVESLDKLEEKVKKEQLKETKIRGQKDITDYERA